MWTKNHVSFFPLVASIKKRRASHIQCHVFTVPFPLLAHTERQHSQPPLRMDGEHFTEFLPMEWRQKWHAISKSGYKKPVCKRLSGSFSPYSRGHASHVFTWQHHKMVGTRLPESLNGREPLPTHIRL